MATLLITWRNIHVRAAIICTTARRITGQNLNGKTSLVYKPSTATGLLVGIDAHIEVCHRVDKWHCHTIASIETIRVYYYLHVQFTSDHRASHKLIQHKCDE